MKIFIKSKRNTNVSKLKSKEIKTKNIVNKIYDENKIKSKNKINSNNKQILYIILHFQTMKI